MPILKQAKKALCQNKKRASRNKTKLDEIDSLKRHFRKAIENKDTKKSEELYHQIEKKIDKAAKKSVVHRNQAARIKSRMTKKLQNLKKT